MHINRRHLLSLIALGSCQGVIASTCFSTPFQVLGPFYSGAMPPQSLLDLTRLSKAPAKGTESAQSEQAQGEILVISGQVMDKACRVIPQCRIDIWQANHFGRYHHPQDSDSSGPLDPFFQGAGSLLTDDQGRYQFKTVMPGQYLASSQWTRPPHIHFKVEKNGYQPLVTQMYFSDHRALQNKDYLLQELSTTQRDLLITALAAYHREGLPYPVQDKAVSRVGVFDIVLNDE